MIVLACLMVAGCVSKGPRFHPNARLKAKQTCCVEKKCCQDKQSQKNNKPSHGDSLGKRIDDAQKRIKKAVDEGKMTPEEGKEMMNALNKRVRKAKPTHKGKAK